LANLTITQTRETQTRETQTQETTKTTHRLALHPLILIMITGCKLLSEKARKTKTRTNQRNLILEALETLEVTETLRILQVILAQAHLIVTMTFC